RPQNSRLSSAKFARVFGWQAPQWRASVEVAIGHLPIGRACIPVE
ncbi:MAG: NAD(P)-dependent oxidoreductase, partial [Mesorhizobium sp.]